MKAAELFVDCRRGQNVDGADVSGGTAKHMHHLEWLGEYEADREAVEIEMAGVRIHSFQSFQQFQCFQTSERQTIVFVLTCTCLWPNHYTVTFHDHEHG